MSNASHVDPGPAEKLTGFGVLLAARPTLRWTREQSAFVCSADAGTDLIRSRVLAVAPGLCNEVSDWRTALRPESVHVLERPLRVEQQLSARDALAVTPRVYPIDRPGKVLRVGWPTPRPALVTGPTPNRLCSRSVSGFPSRRRTSVLITAAVPSCGAKVNLTP